MAGTAVARIMEHMPKKKAEGREEGGQGGGLEEEAVTTARLHLAVQVVVLQGVVGLLFPH